MKNYLPILLLALPVLVYSQKTEKEQTQAPDTIISQDPLIKGRQYWVIHNLKGQIREQGFMLNGKKDGVWREYNEVYGAISKVTEYREGLQHGAVMSFNINGVVQEDATYMNDKKNGQRTVFGNYNGRPKTVENYKEDILEGKKKTYYDDGKVQEDGYYKNGKRSGVVKWFLQNGSPSMEYTYENGDLSGPAKVFDNGKLKQEGLYKNGNEDGEWKEYSDSVLVKKIYYKDGQIIKEVPVKK